MSRIDNFFTKIPQWMSSKVSIFIYLMLFCYLIVLALAALVVPSLHDLAPSQDTQLVLGNYTNVLSALGASIAAGTGAALHRHSKIMRQNNEELRDKVDDLHRKIDDLSKVAKKEPTKLE